MRFKPKKICLYVLVIPGLFVCTILVLYANNDATDGAQLLVVNDLPHSADLLRKIPPNETTIRKIREKPTNQNINMHLETKCENLTNPVHPEVENKWYFVSNSNKDVLVFSAYYIGDSGNVVVIGAKSRFSRLSGIICQFWTLNETSGTFGMAESWASSKDHTEHHGLR